jgi:tetratricopeptide (TPR) repeat protein
MQQVMTQASSPVGAAGAAVLPPSGNAEGTAQISSEAAALLHAARNAAFAETSQGRVENGLQLLMDALRHEPQSHDLLSDMAALLLAAGALENAVEFARIALGVSPEHGPSLYSLGFALAGLGEHQEAYDTLCRIGQDGEALRSLMAEAPDLLPLVKTELQRLQLKLAEQQAAAAQQPKQAA